MPDLNYKTVNGRWGRVCCCMCWIVGSQGQVASRSDGCFGPSMVGGMGLYVCERPGCCVHCGVLCRRALGSDWMGKGGYNCIADVSACGVWMGKRFII